MQANVMRSLGAGRLSSPKTEEGTINNPDEKAADVFKNDLREDCIRYTELASPFYNTP